MSWCGVCGNSGRAVASNGKGESETNTKLPYQDRKSRTPQSHTALQPLDHITQAIGGNSNTAQKPANHRALSIPGSRGSTASLVAS
jgi:hypothetical protein